MSSNPSPPAGPATLAGHWRARFGERVHKVALDAGLSCPNRDGTLGTGGCAFCDPAAFSPAVGDPRPVAEQLRSGIDRLRRRGIRLAAAYFQPHTNTYAPVDRLRELWDSVSRSPEVVALCVGTRPDCVPDRTLDLLAGYRARFEVWLELGLQSANDETLARLSRGHTAAQFADACRRARARGLRVCAHVILGLPGEAARDERHTARFLSELGVEGVKLHHLAVVRGTALEGLWASGGLRVLAEGEYVERAADFLCRLPPETVVHRVVGETAGSRLLAPRYGGRRVAEAVWRRVRGDPDRPGRDRTRRP